MSNRIAGLIAVTLIAGAAALAAPSPVNAEVFYPWCAHYSGWDGDMGTNCGFVTWNQCMDTIRGVGGICYENPAYPRLGARPAKIRKAHPKKY
jgi:hypothetical protein